MRRESNPSSSVSRRLAGSATLAFLASFALGAPVTTTAQKPTPPTALPGAAGAASGALDGAAPAGVMRPPGPSVSPAAAERLRKAGLDPRDPNLGAKLKSLVAGASAGYVRAHVMSSTAAAAGGAARSRRASIPGVASAAGSRVAAFGLPVQGTIDAAYDDTPSLLGGNPQISTRHGKTWPGRYHFLVRTKQKVAVKGGPGFSFGSASLSYGCSAKLLAFTWAGAADDPNFIAGSGLQKLSPSNGSFPYYVDVDFSNFEIGQPRSAQMTLSFENAVTAPLAVTLQPDIGTAKVAVTIDHTPQVTGVGLIYPWGSTGFSNANAKMGSPSTERVGGGNWQTQTSGDDLVGVGVALAPGWKVTSTAIKSAMSATSPQDLTPDNTWRGATVTTPPSGNDLRTAVHWHYSGIDSLDYTIEWTLEGPMGQRPLLTMAKYGSCDQ